MDTNRSRLLWILSLFVSALTANAQCAKHSECPAGQYCDSAQACFPEDTCCAYQDPIDGTCPNVECDAGLSDSNLCNGQAMSDYPASVPLSLFWPEAFYYFSYESSHPFSNYTCASLLGYFSAYFEGCEFAGVGSTESPSQQACTSHSDCTSDQYCGTSQGCTDSNACCFHGDSVDGACPHFECVYSQQDYIHTVMSTCCTDPSADYICKDHVPEPLPWETTTVEPTDICNGGEALEYPSQISALTFWPEMTDYFTSDSTSYHTPFSNTTCADFANQFAYTFHHCNLILPDYSSWTSHAGECASSQDCPSEEYCTQQGYCEHDTLCCWFNNSIEGEECPHVCQYSQQDYTHAVISTCCVHPTQDYICSDNIPDMPEPPNQSTAPSPNDTGGQEADVSPAVTPSMQLVSLMASWLWMK